MKKAIDVNDDSIETILSENEIVLLDFHASWCGPCKTLGPIIDELATDNTTNDKISIGKINVDENSSTAVGYGVRRIPTIILFKNGEVVDRMVGSQSKSTLQGKIDALLS